MIDETDILTHWRSRRRTPVPMGTGPTVDRLLHAIHNQQRVQIQYTGGAEPGGTRWVYPQEVFHIVDYHRIYLGGFCLKRQEERAFRLDRLKILNIIGKPVDTSETNLS